MTISRNQQRTLYVIDELASRLVCDFPQIAQFYEEGLTQNEIAKRVIPLEANHNIGIAQSAISKALEDLLSQERRKELEYQHRAKVLGEYKNIGWERALKSQGKTRIRQWERDLLEVLIQLEQFNHQSGARSQTPNYQLISSHMNDIYHTSRTPKAWRNIMYQIRTQKNR
jgi:hypothetical protein